jgi:hypothetical protein
MENKKITVNVPDGYIMKEEKTENGLILTFVKGKIAEEDLVCFDVIEQRWPGDDMWLEKGKRVLELDKLILEQSCAYANYDSAETSALWKTRQKIMLGWPKPCSYNYPSIFIVKGIIPKGAVYCEEIVSQLEVFKSDSIKYTDLSYF